MRKFTAVLLFVIISGFGFAQFVSPEMEFAQEKLAQREEFYFTFKCENRDLVREISRQLSIDKVQGTTVYAYANPEEFEVFLTYNLNFEPVYEYYNSPKVINMATTVAQMASWDRYPTHAVYLQMLDDFVTNYPTLCKLETIGTSVDGYPIKCLIISDNINSHEDEPEFWWSGTMHGDETTGWVMILRMADYLLSNYSTNSQVTNLVNNMEIYINPLANPDGTYYGSAGGLTVSGARRNNANNIDLNRNFPTLDGSSYTLQPEIQCMMDYSATHDFVMGANTHGGIELLNFPWDTWQSWENPHVDQNWWEYVCFKYADEAHLDAPAGYLDGPGSMDYPNGYNNTTGVTHGADWYYAIGSRQDYMNYYRNYREVTLELSNTKMLGTENLNAYWGYNKDAMLLYMEQCLYGFRGIVTDACTGSALSDVRVEIVGYDEDNTHVFSSAPVGNYHRPIYAGTYNVTFSKTGYASKTLPVSVINNQSTRLDVELIPTSVAVPGFTASSTSINVGQTVTFTNTTSGTVTSRTWTFEGGSPTTSTAASPGAITYNTAGVYDVTLSVTSSGCTVEEFKPEYITVTIPGAPVADFTADFTSSCSGVIQFTNSSVDGDTYLWNFGDGQTTTDINPQHVYTASGSYTVVLTATNAYGNNTITKTDYITIALAAAPVTTGAESCSAASLTLNATGSGTLQWWDAPSSGNLVTTGTSYTNTFASTTTYYVQSGVSPGNYTVGNDDININGGNHTSNAYYLIFTAYDDFTLVSVQVNSSTAGDRVIELRNSGGTLLQSFTADLDPGINTVTLNFNIPQGTNYQLRCGSTTPNLYRNNSGTTFPYTVPGVVSITGTNASDVNYYYYYYNWVISYDGGCVSSRTPVTASILGTPGDVTVTGGGTQCGGTATLNATGGTGGTIYWQNTTSNGTSTATASTSQSVSTSGTYYFRALSGASCWGNQGSATVTINAVPTAVSVSGGGTQCGGSMTLTASGGTGGTIYWQGTTSGGTSTTTASASQSVSTSGTYYFRSRSAAGCWGPEGSATVTINPLPGDVTVSGAGVQCGGSRTLTATGGTGGTIYWQNTTNNGTNTATASSSQTVSSTGTYYFRAQSAEGCWGNQGYATVTINPAVSASVSTTPESTPGANDGTATASASAGTAPYNFTWQSPYTGNPLTGLTGGAYCVTVQDFNNCTASACGTVSTNGAAPVAAFSADVTEGCDNLTVTFTDLSSNFPTSWAWDFGDGATSTEQNPVHQYTTVGGSTVSLTATNSSGSDDLILNYYIYVGETPTLELSMIQETIAGNDGSATVVATGGSMPYIVEWNNGFNNFTINGLTAGEYCVTVTETGNDCQASACIDVTQEGLSAPVADFEADDTEACLSLNVNFTDLSTNNPTEWYWEFGDGTTSTEQNPTHTYSTVGVYTVSLTATNGIGSDQEVKIDHISVFAKPTLSFDVTNESATGMNDGSIELTITGGAEPYTINWSNGANTLIISDLAAGIFSVAVIDDNGCMSTGSAEVQIASSISQNIKSEIIIYPNPSNGIFTIEANERITSIQIIDATGRICNEISSNDTKVNVSANLVSGVYFVKVKTSENSGLFKMIVQ